MSIQTTTQCDKCGRVIMNCLERVERRRDEGDIYSSNVTLCRKCAGCARDIQLYDYVSAVFDPRVTTDLQYPDTVNFIGKRLYWQASWIIEGGPYDGQLAMCVQVTSDDERTPFCWVPECDLVDVRHEDGRQVHAKVMAYLEGRKPVGWTGADQIVEGQGVLS